MKVVLLLGRPDSPTDGLADYCARLAPALAARGLGPQVPIVRVPWHHEGWIRALRNLAGQGPAWRGSWVLLQYTALQWSRRGLPVGLLAVLWILRRRGVRIATVFHDSDAWPLRPDVGVLRRTADQLRAIIQRRVMRAVARRSGLVVLAVSAEGTPWLPAGASRVVVVPVGANIPEPSTPSSPGHVPTVAVFAFSGPPALAVETEVIAGAMRAAADRVPGLRLVVCGRNADIAAEPLRRALAGARVTLDVRGIVPADAITRQLSEASVMLFVRGQVSARRGSAVAALACGLPIVGYAGSETGFPLTEAGVSLVPSGDRAALANALVRVLTDAAWRDQLRRRSASAYAHHFAWPVIADRLWAELAGA